MKKRRPAHRRVSDPPEALAPQFATPPTSSDEAAWRAELLSIPDKLRDERRARGSRERSANARHRQYKVDRVDTSSLDVSASVSDPIQSPTLQRKMIHFFEKRSATYPVIGKRRSSGKNCTSPETASADAFPVFSYTCQPIPTGSASPLQEAQDRGPPHKMPGTG